MKPKIRRLLIANRGEIAIRVARTCKEMGITSIALHAAGEKSSPHVQACDEAYSLSSQGVEAYLDIDQILSLAVDKKCDAIHPGYGFLAENPRFASACEQANVKFVGPPSHAIHALGDKVQAKRLAKKLLIPIVPAAFEEQRGEAGFERQVRKLGLPIFIKPAAGGGGKGMVLVRNSAELPEALARARREAKAAFGDSRLLAERCVEKARHVEVQIMADGRGNVSHVGERDCTLQRRHQKVVEETPSPSIDSIMRNKLFDAAIQLAQEGHYVNAGTVEFLVGPEGEFYFMEMNTRLQVEHPVTEMRAGVDLVRAQILIAQGAPVREALGEYQNSGCTLECRIYAEDPESGFLPGTGKVLKLTWPGDGVRVDSGIMEGMEIKSDFDPLLAKVILKAANRKEAIRRMDKALSQTVLLGVSHNINFLRWIMQSDVFAAARHDTDWIERELPKYQKWEEKLDGKGAIAAAVYWERRQREVQAFAGDEEEWRDDPWRTLGKWRLGLQT